MESRTRNRVAKASIAAAMVIAVPFIKVREGESLKAYQDVAGVWTICHGETKGVKPGQQATKAECDALTDSRVDQFMTQVSQLIHVEVSPETLAAHTSFAYNVGIGGWDPAKQKWVGYISSQALAETNKGNIAAGCVAMGNWYRADGKDCRDWRNLCSGLISRRHDEVNLCLSGVH